jgi:hypothetical protein
MVMYLEDVLGSLNSKADVCIKLSSQTIYGLGETDDPHVMQDSCGNHRVMNWLDALVDRDLFKKFLVDKVEASPMYGEPHRIQWTITLVNSKNEDTDALDIQSNRRACMESGIYGV